MAKKSLCESRILNLWNFAGNKRDVLDGVGVAVQVKGQVMAD